VISNRKDSRKADVPKPQPARSRHAVSDVPIDSEVRWTYAAEPEIGPLPPIAATGSVAAADPSPRPSAEAHRAGVRVAAVVPGVAIPTSHAVAGDAHVLDRPVAQTPGMDARGGQAVSAGRSCPKGPNRPTRRCAASP
jgi:hypothetical protein